MALLEGDYRTGNIENLRFYNINVDLDVNHHSVLIIITSTVLF